MEIEITKNYIRLKLLRFLFLSHVYQKGIDGLHISVSLSVQQTHLWHKYENVIVIIILSSLACTSRLKDVLPKIILMSFFEYFEQMFRRYRIPLEITSF